MIIGLRPIAQFIKLIKNYTSTKVWLHNYWKTFVSLELQMKQVKYDYSKKEHGNSIIKLKATENAFNYLNSMIGSKSQPYIELKCM